MTELALEMVKLAEALLDVALNGSKAGLSAENTAKILIAQLRMVARHLEQHWDFEPRVSG